MLQPIIRVLDVETTGFHPPEAEVIEIGWQDIAQDQDGSWHITTETRGVLVRPERPIPPETSAIHHLIDSDVANAKSFSLAMAYVVKAVKPGAQLVALAAHNAKMERQWLEAEFPGLPWLCTYKCALTLWPEAPGHSNQTLRYWLAPKGLDRSRATPSHRAGPDAYVSAHLLLEMLGGPPVAPAGVTLQSLLDISSKPALLPRVPFGKSKGMKWSEVDFGFLDWILQRDFEEDVIFTARTERDRRIKEFEARRAAAPETAHELTEEEPF